MFNSDAYNQLYDEFLNASVFGGYMPQVSNTYIAHWHSIEDIEEDERHFQVYKEAYLPEIASQFRFQDGILRLDFNGFAINHDGGGFNTDVSETCHWLTPFTKEPGDLFELWYLNRVK